jgi:20S proteasome alpha/beta subunit
MTVVAGVSLFNGVMLIADSRVTVSLPGRPDFYCDMAQKIFPLTHTTVLGFSGDFAYGFSARARVIETTNEEIKAGFSQFTSLAFSVHARNL